MAAYLGYLEIAVNLLAHSDVDVTLKDKVSLPDTFDNKNLCIAI